MLGEIILLSFKRPVEGMIPCDGRELLIENYTRLYSLIGVTYGGNGVSTFRIPKIVETPAPGLVWCIHNDDDYPILD